MSPELLESMLSATPRLSGEKGKYKADEGVKISVVYAAAHGAPASVPEINTIEVQDGFIRIAHEGGRTTLLALERIIGMSAHELGVASTRTGFR